MFSTVCTGVSNAWAGLSRRLVGGVYDYRLVCDGISTEAVQSAITCDGCEVLWGPRTVK